MFKDNEIVVSILCMTYNQEKYIADAVESFLMQKTRFKYEIIIHDDASSDNTASIIKKYERENPDVLKTIFQQKNQYSQGKDILQDYMFPMAKGKYLALCEGDDYWTDEYKLQKQVEALEKNQQCNVCAHAVSIVTSDKKKKIGEMAQGKEQSVFSVEKVILGGGGFVGTNSLMFTSEMFKNVPSFRKIYRIDYSLQIWGTLKGGMLYLPECMAAYRTMATSSWSLTMQQNPMLKIQHYSKLIEMLNCLNEYTKGVYKPEIESIIQYQKYSIALLESDYDNIIKGEYRAIFKKEPIINRLKVYIKKFFPWSIYIYKWRIKYARKK